MVSLPNGATMESSHTTELDIPELNVAASKAHVSLEWPITLLFQLDNYATKDTWSLSSKPRLQSAIPTTPKFCAALEI
jgi:hypothetical protein